MENSFYTVMEVSELIGVSRRTIYDWIKSGKIEAIVSNYHNTLIPSTEIIREERFTLRHEKEKREYIRKASIVFSRKKLPNDDELLELEKTHSKTEIAKMYGCSKQRVSAALKYIKAKAAGQAASTKEKKD
jgi:transcriptional antiterminator